MDELWIAVCDDLEEERRSLARMIHSYAQRTNRTVRFRFYSSGEELLASGQQVAACRILFLDIYMPGLSGVEAARRLRTAGCGTAIVFATTSLDHGLESFDVWAADYLTKPFRQEDIDRALDWCLEHLPEPMQVLPVYTEGETQELPLASVCYLEVYGHHTHIHTLQRIVVVRRSLDDLEAAIDSPDFLRCHRSFLINMNHVQGLEGSDFRMSDRALIPISIANQRQIRGAFIDWTYRKAWEKQ